MADNPTPDKGVLIKELGVAIEPIITNIKGIQDAVGNVSDRVQQSVTNYEKLEERLEAELKRLDQLIVDRTQPQIHEPEKKGDLVGVEGFRVPSAGYIETGRYAGKRVSDLLFAHNLIKRAEGLAVAAKRNPRDLNIVPVSPELAEMAERYKAYTESGSATGDEYVPTEMAAQLWQDVIQDDVVGSHFEQIDQPSNPFQLPLDFAESVFSKGVEITSPSADDSATRNVTMTATELINLKEWSYSLNETSIIALAPALRRNLERGARKYIGNFMMNADATATATGNINLDDATPPSTSYYLTEGQDGLRHGWLVDNTAQEVNANAALNSTSIADALDNMDDYGLETERLRIFSDLRTYLKGIRTLTETITVDKFGPNAAIVRGQVANLFGSPVIPTAAIGRTELDGKISTTAANNTKGQITIAHRDMWLLGFIRRILMEMDVDIKARKWFLVTSFRISIASFGAKASHKHVAGIRNITI